MTDEARAQTDEGHEDKVHDRVDESVADRRELKIERLERAIDDERRHSAELRATVDDLKFKMGILEQSYSKQLEDARKRSDAAESRIAEQGVRIAELDQARQDAIELLGETKTEIDRLTQERDQLRRQLASRDGWQVEGAVDDYSGDEGTINALMNDARWMRDRKPGEDKAKERVQDVETDASPSEELIAPDLVFADRKSDD